MSPIRTLTLLLFVAGCIAQGSSAHADEPFGFDSSLNVYTESPYSKLPLKAVRSDTVIDGPIAKSHIVYTFVDGLAEKIEVGANFFLPQGAILNGFGYFYGTRFIPGKMYANDQAWRIYTAVTSRGRDPGIMDRPEQQDYHTQIYPVLPGQYLTVVIDITQMLPTDAAGSHFTLPMQQPDGIGHAADIDSRLTIEGVADAAVAGNYDDRTATTHKDGRTGLHLSGRWLPASDWRLTLSRAPGVRVAAFSRLASAGRSSGAYAATISVPYDLTNARITIDGKADTDYTMPTLFGDVPANAPISFTGRYWRPGIASVTVRSANHRAIRVKLTLGSDRMADAANPAARIWADKRITALQDDTSRDRKAEVVRLSERYTVVSQFTALLAIPREELENYRRRLAKHKIDTDTQYIGGGGGDPYIRVSAPADARQVVAVFPDGAAKNLEFDVNKHAWITRFDYPFGTPAGDYDVTIVIVHADGRRTRFVLVYENLLTTPKADALDAALTAERGCPVAVRVRSTDAVKATLVTPWEQRMPMTESAGEWTASSIVPRDWLVGATQVMVVLYDGAHDRTEVRIDVNIE